MLDALIQFLQSIYSDFKIKQIVCDFVTDLDGVVWLTDVKHIKTVRHINMASSQSKSKLSTQYMLQLREKRKKCFMCKQYKRIELV